MSLYDLCKTDPVCEAQGVVFEYRDLGIRVTLKRSGGANKGYNKALARRAKDVQRAIDLGLVDTETMEAILCDVFADEVVVMWETLVNGEWKEGIEGKDGELLPFNRDNLVATLRALPLVFERIREDAGKHVHYLASQREAASGN